MCRWFSVLVLVRAGAAFDPADRPGLAAHHRRSARRRLRRPRCAGAARDARPARRAARHRGRRATRRSSASPRSSGSRAPALALLAEMVARPRLRRRRLRSRARSSAQPAAAVARDAAGASPSACSRERLYGAHPYGHLPIGTEASLRAMAVGEARAFHQQMYDPSRVTVIAVGDAIARRALADSIEAAFGSWQADDDRRRPSGSRRAADRRRGRTELVDRAAGRRAAVGAAHRPRRRGANVAGLSRARHAESGARRPVRQPHQLEPARAQGLHLRRAHQLRLPARPRSVRRCMRACSRTRPPTPCARRFASCGRSAASGR